MPISNESLIQYCIEAPIKSFVPAPDTQIISREGWHQTITPSDLTGRMNEIIISHLQKEKVHETFNKIKDEYSQLEIPFQWVIGPMSSPEELKLEVKRHANRSWRFRGMWIESKNDLTPNENIQIQKVTAENFDLYIDAFINCWNDEHAERETIKNRKKSLLLPDSKVHQFIALKDSEPVGVASYANQKTYAYLNGGAVAERMRGHGIYMALVQARLFDIYKSGIPVAVTQAKDHTSAPILEKLGFKTIFGAEMYYFNAPK
jgi:hypothetical protein